MERQKERMTEWQKDRKTERQKDSIKDCTRDIKDKCNKTNNKIKYITVYSMSRFEKDRKTDRHSMLTNWEKIDGLENILTDKRRGCNAWKDRKTEWKIAQGKRKMQWN